MKQLLIALLFLISPITANATLITYTSNAASDGSYLKIVADVTATTVGSYSLGSGLTSYVMTAFDTNDAIQGIVDSDNPNFVDGGYAQFIQFDAAGLISAWEFLGQHSDGSSGACYNCWSGFNSSFGEYDFTGTYSVISNRGTWVVASNPVPEPATLVLIGLGLASIGYRRHRM